MTKRGPSDGGRAGAPGCFMEIRAAGGRPTKTNTTPTKPQILALLSDTNKIAIIDKYGVKHPVFDADNHSDPHPAFGIIDGHLVLKPDFQTAENQATWMDNTSQEYVDLFGDSGTIPLAIAYINGDYRESTAYMPTQTTAGSMLFMFKQWLPKLIYKKVVC